MTHLRTFSVLAPAAVAAFLFLSLACSGKADDNPGQGGTGGMSGVSGGTGGTAPIDGLLVDDFEDGDGIPFLPGGWYGYNDGPNGGLSTLTFTGGTGVTVAVNGPGHQSSKSLEVSYSFDQGTLTYQPYVGFGVSLGSAAVPFDMSSHAGIAYTYQGGAHRVSLQTTEVADYNYYGVNVGASALWKTVILPFTDFSQDTWGARVSFDPSHVIGIDYQARGNTGDKNKIAIDDVYLMKSTGPKQPDMSIRPASPPAVAVLDSIAIANPLQAKAKRYLDRGYNVTNWLEQARFSGFTYDESFVEKLAAAGFKGLRLPVDMDLYVDSTTGTGDTLSVEVNDDLFTVLDAFDTWTKAHGLSLTIDYHQYATLPDKAQPDSVATMVQLWGKVAEHFASNPREDLFFELLNEPELSFGGVSDPSQTEWTAIAERMIEVIRASDTTHTIIFGDVQWYGIGPLSTRQPLSDPNVIYAFHFYDPFIFTHQGASWANMGSTHDIPFPYEPARWSEYYSELGFNSAMESFILTGAQSYYREGNVEAMHNRLSQAKRWAVTNDLPVICNEFGVYDGTSRLEDRARYYEALIATFAELEIPWQHWFMVMDAQGDVIPEYRAAFQLDD